LIFEVEALFRDGQEWKTT